MINEFHADDLFMYFVRFILKLKKKQRNPKIKSFGSFTLYFERMNFLARCTKISVIKWLEKSTILIRHLISITKLCETTSMKYCLIITQTFRHKLKKTSIQNGNKPT